MSDFPPNLEDGELWLPSDIFEEVFRIEVEKITQNLAIETKSFDNEGTKAVDVDHGKTKGTGVFIPQRIQPYLPPNLKERRGTGVFIPYIVSDTLIATPTNQTSGKTEEVIGEVHILGENQPAKEKLFQPSTRRHPRKTKPTCEKTEEVIGGVHILGENQPAKEKLSQPSTRRHQRKTKPTHMSK